MTYLIFSSRVAYARDVAVEVELLSVLLVRVGVYTHGAAGVRHIFLFKRLQRSLFVSINKLMNLNPLI
jgi:hypothetical protein